MKPPISEERVPLPIIEQHIQQGRENLAEFQRSPFHDTLRTEIRDSYTKLFEEYPEEALAECEHYFKKAKKPPAKPNTFSNSQSYEGCWELGTQANPQRVDCFGVEDYLYRFVVLVLSATLPYDGEVVRHRCHNRKCIRPEHLQLGSQQQNKADDNERRYVGRVPLSSRAKRGG